MSVRAAGSEGTGSAGDMAEAHVVQFVNLGMHVDADALTAVLVTSHHVGHSLASAAGGPCPDCSAKHSRQCQVIILNWSIAERPVPGPATVWDSGSGPLRPGREGSALNTGGDLRTSSQRCASTLVRGQARVPSAVEPALVSGKSTSCCAWSWEMAGPGHRGVVAVESGSGWWDTEACAALDAGWRLLVSTPSARGASGSGFRAVTWMFVSIRMR
jgi:hypothetical protein